MASRGETLPVCLHGTQRALRPCGVWGAGAPTSWPPSPSLLLSSLPSSLLSSPLLLSSSLLSSELSPGPPCSASIWAAAAAAATSKSFTLGSSYAEFSACAAASDRMAAGLARTRDHAARLWSARRAKCPGSTYLAPPGVRPASCSCMPACGVHTFKRECVVGVPRRLSRKGQIAHVECGLSGSRTHAKKVELHCRFVWMHSPPAGDRVS